MPAHYCSLLFIVCAMLGEGEAIVEEPVPRREVLTNKPPACADRYGDPLPPGAVARLGTTRLRHASAVQVVTFSGDGRVLASASHGVICLWEVATGKRLHRLTCDQGAIQSLAFSPDGQILASGHDQTIRLRQVATGRELRRLVGHRGSVLSLAFAPD